MHTPDFAIVNAVVRTMGPSSTPAQAVLVRDGRVAVVGTDKEVRDAAGQAARFLDVGGRTVVPGFIDNHNHLSVAAFEPIAVDCSSPPGTTLHDILGRIAARAAETTPGQWIMGMGFQAQYVAEGRYPSRWEIDEVAPDNPVFLIDMSYHAGAGNSRALDLAGISAHSPQPWGGEIVVDSRGEPTGLLLEAAANLPHTACWEAHADRDLDLSVGLFRAKMQEYLAVGLTGIGDACVTAKASEIYRKADASGRLPLTVQQIHAGDHFFAMQDTRRTDVADRILGAETTMLRGGAMKIFYDRAYPRPAVDQTHDGCTRHVGATFYTRNEIRELAVSASRLGMSTAVHSMGNCAIDTVLDAYEAVRRESSDDTILRMEHAFIADPAQASRMASLGVEVVANPGVLHAWGEVFDDWRGEGQGHLSLFPMRAFLDAGVPASIASDYPCAGLAPVEHMWTAVARTTRTGITLQPEESITAQEALRCYTADAARAAGREAEEGSIECGKRANMLVLDRDIVSCPVEQIQDVQVDMTFVDGRLVHERDPQ